MSYPTIALDPGECAAAFQVGALRQYVNAGAGRDGRSRCDQGKLGARVNLHTIGYLAEFAFAKWRNLFPDLTAHPRVGTPDFTLANGQTVDVKATDRADGNLICNVAQNEHLADLYVLAIVQPVGDVFAVTFPGWTTREEFIRPDRIKQLRARSYFMPRAELREWTEVTV